MSELVDIDPVADTMLEAFRPKDLVRANGTIVHGLQYGNKAP